MFFAVVNTILRQVGVAVIPPPPPVVGENWTANRLSLNLDSGSGQWVTDRLSFKIT